MASTLSIEEEKREFICELKEDQATVSPRISASTLLFSKRTVATEDLAEAIENGDKEDIEEQQLFYNFKPPFVAEELCRNIWVVEYEGFYKKETMSRFSFRFKFQPNEEEYYVLVNGGYSNKFSDLIGIMDANSDEFLSEKDFHGEFDDSLSH
ncbi:hypothetical protein Sjap_017142 [Stephania japonica]|uniref:Uncharacterized protein n=1 Tax=Stephania japonica TaxID=461633 RepID=A0AAP0I5L3_9MAGN